MNISHIKKILYIGVGSLVTMTGASANVLLQDNFSGSALDAAIWTPTGWGASRGNVTVTDGMLQMNNNITVAAGANDHKGVRSNINTINFHQQIINVDVGIVSFNKPIFGDGTQENASGSLWFALGAGTSAPNARQNVDRQAFTFNLTWQRDRDGIFLGGYGADGSDSIGSENYLSGVPERVSFTVDQDSYTITLTGAQFLDQAGGLPIGSTLMGTHLSAIQDNYYLSFGVENAFGVNNAPDGDGTFALVGEFSDVTVSVIPEPSTYAALFGMLAAGFILLRRKSRK